MIKVICDVKKGKFARNFLKINDQLTLSIVTLFRNIDKIGLVGRGRATGQHSCNDLIQDFIRLFVTFNSGVGSLLMGNVGAANKYFSNLTSLVCITK